ncbi:conserved hypothetical protein [Culex quinquefasciatus]|uniref:Uncharacterized protein n=1 Tax=Culex quinquefasciatus TaxID=7176 RepID=B0X8A3_CULQU|nr:conserved hypothetical protein [Culex quinquefasciatus]|eukprot:XP_001865875.1 conserved hypothetical protein [Culex quinquefasciatus]
MEEERPRQRCHRHLHRHRSVGSWFRSWSARNVGITMRVAGVLVCTLLAFTTVGLAKEHALLSQKQTKPVPSQTCSPMDRKILSAILASSEPGATSIDPLLLDPHNRKLLLHKAVRARHPKKLALVQFLIKTNLADSDERDDGGRTASEVALSELRDRELASAMIVAEMERVTDERGFFVAVIRRGSVPVYELFLELKRFKEGEIFHHVSSAMIELDAKRVVIAEGLRLFLQYQLVRYAHNHLGGDVGGVVDRNAWRTHFAAIEEHWAVLERSFCDRECNKFDSEFLYHIRMMHNHLYFVKNVAFLSHLPVMEMAFCLAVFVKILECDLEYELYKFLINKLDVMKYLKTINRLLQNVKRYLDVLKSQLTDLVKSLENDKIPTKEEVLEKWKQMKQDELIKVQEGASEHEKCLIKLIKSSENLQENIVNSIISGLKRKETAEIISDKIVSKEVIERGIRNFNRPSIKVETNMIKGKLRVQYKWQIHVNGRDKSVLKNLKRNFIKMKQFHSITKVVEHIDRISPLRVPSASSVKRLVQVLGEASSLRGCRNTEELISLLQYASNMELLKNAQTKYFKRIKAIFKELQNSPPSTDSGQLKSRASLFNSAQGTDYDREEWKRKEDVFNLMKECLIQNWLIGFQDIKIAVLANAPLATIHRMIGFDFSSSESAYVYNLMVSSFAHYVPKLESSLSKQLVTVERRIGKAKDEDYKSKTVPKEKLQEVRKSDQDDIQLIFNNHLETLRNVLRQFNVHSMDDLAAQKNIPDHAILELEYNLLEMCEMLHSVGYYGDNFHLLKHKLPFVSGRNFRNCLAHDSLSYNVITGTTSRSMVIVNALVFIDSPLPLFKKRKSATFDKSFIPSEKQTLVWTLESIACIQIEKTDASIDHDTSDSEKIFGFESDRLLNPICKGEQFEKKPTILESSFHNFPLIENFEEAFHRFSNLTRVKHFTIPQAFFSWKLIVDRLKKLKFDWNEIDSLGRTILHRLIQAGNEEGVADLLQAEQDIDVNAGDSEGRTPLDYAMALGNENCAKMLASKEAQFSDSNQLMAVILHMNDCLKIHFQKLDPTLMKVVECMKVAVFSDNSVILKELSSKIDAEQLAILIHTAAAVSNHVEVVNCLCTIPNVDYSTEGTIYSLSIALYMATLRNNRKIAELSISLGASPNWTNPHTFFPMESAFQLAVQRNDRKLVKMMNKNVTKTFSPHILNHPLQLAVKNHSKRMVRCLEGLGYSLLDTGHILQSAIESDNTAVVEEIFEKLEETYLAEKITDLYNMEELLFRWRTLAYLEEPHIKHPIFGMFPNDMDHTLNHFIILDETAYLVQSTKNSPDLPLKSFVNFTDHLGVSILQQFCDGEGGCDGAKLLIEHGANPLAMNQNKHTPLHQALLTTSSEESLRFLNLYVENDWRSSDGMTRAIELPNAFGLRPLHAAVTGGHAEVVRFLIDCGVNLRVRFAKKSLLPVMLAAKLFHTQIMKLLLDADPAQVNIPDADGNTVAHYAMSLQMIEIVQLVLQYEVNFKLPNQQGESPIEIAIFSFNAEMIKYVLNHARSNHTTNLLDDLKHQQSPIIHHVLLNFPPQFATPIVQYLIDANLNDQIPPANLEKLKLLLLTREPKFNSIALHAAANCGRIENCRFILNCQNLYNRHSKNKLNLARNQYDISGLTPWELAIEGKQKSVIDLFREDQ